MSYLSPTDLWPIKPMLARRTEKPFDSKDFIYELKWDGTRCLAYIENGRVRLQNRRLRDITYRYPEFKDLPKSINAKKTIIDGEIVVLSEGLPDFKKLQSREQTEDPYRIEQLSRLSPALFIAFDLLFLRNKPLFRETLLKRKEILKDILTEGNFIVLSESYDHGVALFKEAIKRGFEGIMAKEKSSLYLPGIRSPHWLKIKKSIEVDAIVCGWLQSDKREFASLILGLYSGDRIIHIGRVGTGFSEKEMKSIKAKLRKLAIKRPLLDIPETHGVKWVRPEIVVRISALEWTQHGKLRAPVFLNIRLDKPPEECTEQQ